jgi:anaerobic selenocysteine-containing dehydrogenase
MKRAGKRGEGKWERVSWDQAIQEVAEKIYTMSQKYGPETFVLPGRTGRQDMGWIANKIARTIGTPNNYVGVTQHCLLPQTHHQVNFGAMLNSAFATDMSTKFHISCGNEMGYSLPLLSGAQVAAEKNGFPRITLDPVCGAFASRCDEWLPVRPGTDLAYALCVIRHLIETDSYDKAFVKEWSNASFLVREDTGELLMEKDIRQGGSSRRYMVFDSREKRIKYWDAEEIQWEGGESGKAHFEECEERFLRNEASTELSPAVLPDTFDPALFGTYEVEIGKHGQKTKCQPAFQLLADKVAEWTFEKASEVTGIPADQIERTIKMLAEVQEPIDFGWDTNHMSTNASQHFLGVAAMRILTGSVDATTNTSFLQFYPVTPMPFPGEWDICYGDGLSLQQKRKRLGYYTHRISCGASWEDWTSWLPQRPENADATLNVPDVGTTLTALETGRPYPVHGIISISSNFLLHDPSTARWLRVLEDETKVELHVCVDFVMTPTAEWADYVFPAQTWMERNYLEFSTLFSPGYKNAYSRAVEPICEAKHDYDFGALLAYKLEEFDSSYNNDCLLNPDNTLFWAGEVGRLWENNTIDEERDRWCRQFTNHTWEECLKMRQVPFPSGSPAKSLFRYKIAGKFPNDTGKANLYSTLHHKYGYPPLPTYAEPAESPISRPDLAKDYPLVLTTGKRQAGWFHSEFRQIPWLRECNPTPEVFINPETAKKYGVKHGDWIWVESPPDCGRAPLNKVMGRVSCRFMVIPEVVSYSQHGWWRPERSAAEDQHGGLEWNCEGLLEAENRTPETGTCGLRSQLCKIYKCSDEDIKNYKPMITRDELEALMPQPEKVM